MKKNINDAIFDFAYHAALNDATLQNAYSGKKKNIEDNKNARNIVKAYIDAVVAGANPDFMEIAKKVNSEINDKNFHFGNIQKLINMTAKYIYISCYVNEGLKKNFACCHCPMDNIMIKKVKKEYLEYIKDKKDLYLQIPIGGGKTSLDVSKISWSKIGFEVKDSPQSIKVYMNFQEMVKILAKEKGISPIEYDFINWSNE